MRIRDKILLIAALLIFFYSTLYTGCSNNTGAPASNPEVSGTATETGYHVKFFYKGEQVASLGLTELHSVPETTVEMGGDTPETGPTLQSVLELVGIKEYSKVTISGMTKGRLATAELTLQRAEITEGVMLDFNNQGKTKLCGKQIPDSNWIVDVTEIRAE